LGGCCKNSAEIAENATFAWIKCEKVLNLMHWLHFSLGIVYGCNKISEFVAFWQLLKKKLQQRQILRCRQTWSIIDANKEERRNMSKNGA